MKTLVDNFKTVFIQGKADEQAQGNMFVTIGAIVSIVSIIIWWL